MQTVTATKVSGSKDGKTAMVIVHGKADGKPFTATRHVVRQVRNGPYIGVNPDPRTETKRQAAGAQVTYWSNEVIRLTAALVTDALANKPEVVQKTEKALASAKACLETAKQIYDETCAEFPTKVEFQLA